jgi:hypothetical protein
LNFIQSMLLFFDSVTFPALLIFYFIPLCYFCENVKFIPHKALENTFPELLLISWHSA